MNVLITGSKGFIGKNSISELKNRDYNDINEITRDTKEDQYEIYCHEADFVCHFIGINRTEEEADFMHGNYNETKKLIETLVRQNNTAPILYTSSIQAEIDTPYGRSKLASEKLLKEYEEKYGGKVYIYRLPNIFGKWCKPDYNSVISTFCYKIARNMPIEIHDADTVISLAYIDDVVDEFIRRMEQSFMNKAPNQLFYQIPDVYQASIGEIAESIKSFHEMRINKQIPNISDVFIRKLYSTYVSYLPEDSFSNSLKQNTDNRGCFIELMKLAGYGQVSVNIIKPGMKKGGHWHQTKNEKFFVLQGDGVIIFNKVNDDNIINYNVSGNNPQAIDIPPGYMHTIINQSDIDMIVVIWADEIYDPNRPDTYSYNF